MIQFVTVRSFRTDLASADSSSSASVMSISQWWIQQLPTSPTTVPPNSYLFAAEIIVHCMRLSESPNAVLSPEFTARIQSQGKAALQSFCDLLMARQRSGKPLIRQSDHRDGLFISSLTIVFEAVAKYGLHIDEVPEFSRPKRTRTGLSVTLRRFL